MSAIYHQLFKLIFVFSVASRILVVVYWTAGQMLDRTCIWGMIHTKIHLICLGCSRPNIALRCLIKHHSFIHLFNSVHSIILLQLQRPPPRRPPATTTSLPLSPSAPCPRTMTLRPPSRWPISTTISPHRSRTRHLSRQSSM